jgi:hypothetical protein
MLHTGQALARQFHPLVYNAPNSVGENTLALLRPKIEEFAVGQNEVIHKPTDAKWTAHPGIGEPHLYETGKLRDVLGSGDHYQLY